MVIIHCICKALVVVLPMPRVLCMLMMHCICNLMLEPWGWNFPCLESAACAHDPLYLQSHFASLAVELPMPRVLCVCSRCTGSAVKFSPALSFVSSLVNLYGSVGCLRCENVDSCQIRDKHCIFCRRVLGNLFGRYIPSAFCVV